MLQLGMEDEEIFEDIRRVNGDVGKSRDDVIGSGPTAEKYNREGEASTGAIQGRFNSWANGLVLAGYRPRIRGSNSKASNEQLIEDVERVRNEIGHPPSDLEYAQHGEHSIAEIVSEFGSAAEAIE